MPGQNYEPLTPAADSDQEWYDDSSDMLHPTRDAISVQWFRKFSRFLLTMLGISLAANVLLVTKFRTTAINGGVSTFGKKKALVITPAKSYVANQTLFSRFEVGQPNTDDG